MAKTLLDRKDGLKEGPKDVAPAKEGRAKEDRVPGQQTQSLPLEGWR